MTDSINGISKSFLAVAKVISPKLRRLYKERQAGRMPVGDISDLLEKGMGETLDRLIGGNVTDGWWKKILDTIGQKYISPEFLRTQAIKEWLSYHQVQNDIKLLAREQIMGKEDYEPDTFQRLRKIYAEKTGEDERLANGPIDVIVTIIVAGYFGSFTPEIEPVAGMVQEHDRDSKKAYQELHDGQKLIEKEIKKLRSDHYVVESHNKLAKQEIEKILKRRSIEPTRTFQEIKALTKKVVGGDLDYADNSIKAEVFYWAARLHASKIETLFLTREYLTKLDEIDPKKDTRIIDALISEVEGDTDRTLQILRDIDTADGRSTFFVTCKRINGNDDALLWFGEQADNDNPDFFTGIGWYNFAVTLAETDRWVEAAKRLNVIQDYWENWPDLAYIEGVVSAALLLPEELRPYVLESGVFHLTIRTMEGSEADIYRARAKECFEAASKLHFGIDQKGRAQAALDWHLWLRLTDPKTEIAEDARQELSENMKEISKAVDLIPLARAFKIDFDDKPLKKYLAQRKRTGGLNDRELMAELFLAEIKMSPKERIDFILNEEEKLNRVVLKATLSWLLIESLVEDGQTKRAKDLLEERKGNFVEQDFRRIKAMIDEKAGVDPRANLEELYAEDACLINLQNLVSYLKRTGDLDALQPRLEELFEKERTAENAYFLIQCFRRNAKIDLNRILNFFNEIEDLVDANDNLLSEKAWALSHIGRLMEAQEINSELLKKRDNEDDLLLEINIALQLGNWERFSTIVSNAIKHKDSLRPDMLIRLASLSSEVDADANRAIELAKTAVDKGAEDPKILAEAYFLAIQLGRENQESGEWFGRAIELSSDDSPFQKVDIRTLAEEIMPARREQAIKIERAVLEGNISLQAAANDLGQLLSRILIQVPLINSELQDSRKRIVLPIRSGSRGIVEMQSEWKICLDTTSIMVLHHIDMLEEIIKFFQKIILDPDTMVFLLNERRRARFHQPSRVKRAEEFRSLIDRNLIKIAPLTSDPPKELIDEVGKDFAELIAEAKKLGGLVVRPFPIHKISSLLEQEANLGKTANCIISTKAFVEILHKRKGVISAEAFKRANRYLSVQDQGGALLEEFSAIDRPLYLDELSITYLQQTDLLGVVCNSGLDIFVHPSSKNYNAAIIEESRGGNELSELLNNIRLILYRAINEGKAEFLQRSRRDDKDEQFKFFQQIAPTLANVMEDTANCDAFCIDDRFFNKHMNIADKIGRTIPIVCVPDLLKHLEKQGSITKDHLYICFQKLRRAGFVFIPILIDELENILDSSSFNENGTMVETAEMRLMRHSLMRIRCLDMISLPEEQMFLQQVQLSSVMVIRRIWSDESMAPEKVRELSNWVWRNITPSPLDWVKDLRESEKKEIARDRFAQHYNFLLKPMAISEERYDKYLNWLEDDVLTPLLSANADLIDALASLAGKDIELMIEDIENDTDTITNDG